VVCALTSLASYVVPSFYEPIIVLRILFILIGGILGPIGIVMLGLCVLFNICAIHSFGVPYTAPLTPFSKGVFKDGLLRIGQKRLSADEPFTIKSLPGGEWKEK
ncbi:MAG: spore germination protein, partial [Oscillospiraceae bacterium]